MISYVKGILLLREPGRVILNTGNLGFTIRVDQITELQMSAVGEQQELYTYHVVGDKEMSLYGFDSLLKLEVFELLLAANKVGPKIALSFLSALPPEDIIRSILSKDPKTFGKIVGAGKKILSQVILDCHDKASRLAEKVGLIAALENDSNEPVPSPENQSDTVNSALKQLGFTASEIRSSLRHVEGLKSISSMTQEDVVQECLKFFYQSLK